MLQQKLLIKDGGRKTELLYLCYIMQTRAMRFNMCEAQ